MKKSKIIVMLLLIIISVMAVAYSIFATELTLNGESKITKNWKVKITGVEVKEVSDGCNPGEPEFTDTTVAFSSELGKPGDKIIYVITIKNTGNIDAVLNNVEFTPDDENGSKAIVYSTTRPSDNLKTGEQTSFTVTVEYDKETLEVPDVKNKEITGVIEYIQK